MSAPRAGDGGRTPPAVLASSLELRGEKEGQNTFTCFKRTALHSMSKVCACVVIVVVFPVVRVGLARRGS